MIDLSGKQVVQQLPLIDGSVNALEAFMIIRQSSLLEASEEAVTTEELTSHEKVISYFGDGSAGWRLKYLVNAA